MYTGFFILLIGLIMSQPLSAANEPSSLNSQMLLRQAKTMHILKGDLPPVPAELAHYKTTDDCSGDSAPRAIVAYLSDEATLWGLCQKVSANNVDYVFFVAKDGKATLAQFATPANKPERHGILTNPAISNVGRVLSSLFKEQDQNCVLGEWIWDGNQFQLLTWRKMTDCVEL